MSEIAGDSKGKKARGPVPRSAPRNVSSRGTIESHALAAGQKARHFLRKCFARSARVRDPSCRGCAMPCVFDRRVGAFCQEHGDRGNMSLDCRSMESRGCPVAARWRRVDVHSSIEEQSDYLDLSTHAGEYE